MDTLEPFGAGNHVYLVRGQIQRINPNLFPLSGDRPSLEQNMAAVRRPARLAIGGGAACDDVRGAAGSGYAVKLLPRIGNTRPENNLLTVRRPGRVIGRHWRKCELDFFRSVGAASP